MQIVVKKEKSNQSMRLAALHPLKSLTRLHVVCNSKLPLRPSIRAKQASRRCLSVSNKRSRSLEGFCHGKSITPLGYTAKAGICGDPMWRSSQRKNSWQTFGCSISAPNMQWRQAALAVLLVCSHLRQVSRGFSCMPQRLEIFDSTVWAERALACMPQEDSRRRYLESIAARRRQEQ